MSRRDTRSKGGADVEARRALLKVAAAAVRKSYRGSIIDTAKKSLEFPSVWASTGSLALDRLCAGFNPGGVPMGKRYGRILHVAGEWSCGKSVILDHIFRSVIVDLHGLGMRTETEGSADPHFANAIGLPLDLLDVSRPGTFEEAFDWFEAWHEAVRKEDEEIPVVWGFDSLDSTESEKSAGSALSESGGWHYGGGRGEVLGVGLRRMARICSRYPTTLVMLNQTRDNVGVMFGPKKRTPGGNAPHFYASLEVMLKGAPRPGGGFVRSAGALSPLSQAAAKRLGLFKLEDAGSVVGRYIRAKVTKTKVGTTFDSEADFYIDFRKGLHPWEGLAERMFTEGHLRSNESFTEFEMDGQAFASKKDWLNHVAQHPEVLALRAPGTLSPDEEEPPDASERSESVSEAAGE